MSNIFITSDLSLAAYLVMKNLNLLSAKKNDIGKFEFHIDDPDKEAERLSLEYVNSECCKFDNQVRTIKKLLYTK